MPAASPTARLIDAHGKQAAAAVPLFAVTPKTWKTGLTPREKTWAKAQGFDGKPGGGVLLPAAGGVPGRALVGIDDATDPWAWATAATKLPPGLYALTDAPSPEAATAAALGWALTGYAFTRYRSSAETPAAPRLVWPAEADRAAVTRDATALFLVRDLINTPAADMGPAELAAAAKALAEAHGASCAITHGKALEKEFPAVHAVGKGAAADRAPRLIDLIWRGSKSKKAPRVTLVGKGVCFDSGGLDIKPSSAMKLMKKDMGGAANALGLAAMIMAAGLPIRLRVIVPAVENAVSAAAFRPLDIVRTRSGKTVEIGNTDAEGRVILADALTLACEEGPDLLIDLATLTGAARSALGPDIPALFTDDEPLAVDLRRAAETTRDPLWRLPLYAPYRRYNESKTADISNSGDSPFAGAITAALFLAEFVTPPTTWAHIDLYAWNPTDRPGRPHGGEAQTIRALFALLAERHGKKRPR